jgi:CDP-glucose 4,6-dehydratase
MTEGFWRGRHALVTGHQGFKGSWLVSLLAHLGATTVGFGYDKRPDPLLSRLLRPQRHTGIEGDVNETARLEAVLREHEIEALFHLAAQPFVLKSYDDPIGTFRDNVLGTASVLDAACRVETVKAIVVVTSDKVYENREWDWAYRETDALGGKDPYSASKAAAEIVTRSMTHSFYRGDGKARVATGRAGNVIGGGDWGENRLVPDAARAFAKGEPLVVRNPGSRRPWQHVLDPLWGYVRLAESLLEDAVQRHDSCNFGPAPDDIWPVSRVADTLAAVWGGTASWTSSQPAGKAAHEARLLAVDSSRAHAWLGWQPRWATGEAIERTARWYKGFYSGEDPQALVAADIVAFLGQTP